MAGCGGDAHRRDPDDRVDDQAWRPLDEWPADDERAIGDLEHACLIRILATPPPNLVYGAFDPLYDDSAAVVREVAGRTRPLIDIAQRWYGDGIDTAAEYYGDMIHQGTRGQAMMTEMAADLIRAMLPVGE